MNVPAHSDIGFALDGRDLSIGKMQVVVLLPTAAHGKWPLAKEHGLSLSAFLRIAADDYVQHTGQE